MPKKNQEKQEPASQLGAFDWSDGHYCDLKSKSNWGFDKKGKEIYLAPCIVNSMNALNCEQVAVGQLIAAVSAYANNAYSGIQKRRLALWNDIFETLHISKTVDLLLQRDNSLILAPAAEDRNKAEVTTPASEAK